MHTHKERHRRVRMTLCSRSPHEEGRRAGTRRDFSSFPSTILTIPFSALDLLTYGLTRRSISPQLHFMRLLPLRGNLPFRAPIRDKRSWCLFQARFGAVLAFLV